MKKQLLKTVKTGREAAAFFVPLKNTPKTSGAPRVTKNAFLLIPTYKPSSITYKLISDALKFNPFIQIVVIDDNSPLNDSVSARVFAKMRGLQKETKRLTLLRTPHKHLKAGALNYGIAHIIAKKVKSGVLITVDDDVVIAPDTLAHLIEALQVDETLGAVCSTARVKNKKKNLLTRLQGLEYHGFNITKLSDNGFLLGPLVMPGMLTAFRFDSLQKIGGFSSDRLLEDYDITVRVKNLGYKTAIIQDAIAWTYAPETLKDLMKQRIRWSYGGLVVISEFYKNVRSVFQDILGHSLFISLFLLILLSFIYGEDQQMPSVLIYGLIILALLQFAIAYIFSLITMRTYPERDKKDWLIKMTILPEFAYSNLLSLVLIGSYGFLMFNLVSKGGVRVLPGLFRVQKIGLKGFSKIGYTNAWGTRA